MTKTEAKTHTPGPWNVAQAAHRSMAVVCDADENHLAYVTGETVAEQLRDARLIAAAPKMLEALQDVLDRATMPGFLRDQVKAAIAAATGSAA